MTTRLIINDREFLVWEGRLGHYWREQPDGLTVGPFTSHEAAIKNLKEEFSVKTS